MSGLVAAPTTPRRHPWLRAWLAAIAVLQTWSAWSAASAAWTDGPRSALPVLAQTFGTAALLISPLIATAALAFALSGHLQRAIMALGALLLTAWLSDLPSLAVHGLDLSMDLGGLHAISTGILQPTLAVASIGLAVGGRHPRLAGCLVSVPTAATAASVVLFIVGATIYGI